MLEKVFTALTLAGFALSAVLLACVVGLLYLTISNSSTTNSSTRQLYVPWYDAYGNIMGYEV